MKPPETFGSMNQESSRDLDDRELLGDCCVSGSILPVYKLSKDIRSSPSVSHCNNVNSTKNESNEIFLDMVILSQWEDRAARGLFRYDVTACETKVLPGEFGFIAQLNEGRHSKKRPTEFRVDQVLQPFDSAKFNFTKALKDELLFCLEQGDSEEAIFSPAAAIADSTNAVIINVSPIEYGHVLLVPRIMDNIPQRMDGESLLLALTMAAKACNPFFRIGYNSLGAFASINHLHFQAYYLAASFSVERAPRTILVNRKCHKGVKISELTKYPVKGLAFESGLDNLYQLSMCVARLCCRLQEKNIPFNFLISDCGLQVYLFPQCYAERQANGVVDKDFIEAQVNPAVWEISGHMVLKRRQDYEKATEDYVCNLLAEVSLENEKFQTIKQMCLEDVSISENSSVVNDVMLLGNPLQLAVDDDGAGSSFGMEESSFSC